MLLLREVHFVLASGECRPAFVIGDGAALDTADLHVYFEWWDLPWPEALALGNVREEKAKRYDAAGAPSTWHTASDCPRPTRG